MTLEGTSTYRFINVKCEEGLAWVTITRPEVRNALNRELMAELCRLLEELESDREARVIILTGEGDKAFVAGADINEIEGIDHYGAYAFCRRGLALMQAVERLGKPVIAMVNGFALGGGCELALACDMRFASDKAKFGLPEINLGLIPGYGGTQRLARIVGKGKALELILTGAMIDAQEARRIGLVNEVFPHDALKAEVEKKARIIAGKSLVTLHLAKEAVTRGLEMTCKEGCAHESSLFALACATEDKVEGIRAFLDKKVAHFTDK
ncbi:MAG: enoyl-CoA hydratase/isomerase family protein [Vulcanimicrobiota bacterium]